MNNAIRKIPKRFQLFSRRKWPKAPSPMSSALYARESSSPSAGVTQSALRADIIIAGQPDPDDPDSVNDVTDPLVMESGRPVLFVPYKTHCRKKLIALLLLSMASVKPRALPSIHSRCCLRRKVLTSSGLIRRNPLIRAWISPAHRFLMPFAAMASMLIPMLSNSNLENSADKVLRRRIAENNASLFVMGAYSQSRLKEWVFGGVTSSIMADMPCLTLMSR